jgi:hypothetical protein
MDNVIMSKAQDEATAIKVTFCPICGSELLEDGTCGLCYWPM